MNVCIYRLPQNISIVSPRSFCPRCRTTIKAYDNIPLLGYVFLRGRCRHCGERFSWRYPLVEALTGGLALALFWKFGLTLSFFSFFAFTAALLVITFIHLNQSTLSGKRRKGGDDKTAVHNRLLTGCEIFFFGLKHKQAVPWGREFLCPGFWLFLSSPQ